MDVREKIREEYKKCAADCVYFTKKYITISAVNRGKVLFDLYPFQEKTMRELAKHRYTIIAKGRQLGISTVESAFSLHKLAFTRDYEILILATTQETAKELLSKIQLAYEQLPIWLRQTMKPKTSNKLELAFSNGSRVRAVASSEKSVRSKSLSLLIIDEAAFIDDFDAIWTAAQATLATGGDCHILSSANGVDNKFHELWADAIEGNSTDADPFFPIYLPWHVHPDRDEAWAAEQKSKLGPRKFAQEHAVDFLTSGHTVIDGDTLKWYSENTVTAPIEKRHGGNMWIWELPKPGKSYLIPADVARGDGNDYSAFYIFDEETLNPVATFKAKIPTREFAKILNISGLEYNNGLLAVDNANMGWDVVQELINMDYPNLYYTFKNDPYYDPNIQLRKNYDLKDKKDMVPGFTMSTMVRVNMVSKLEAILSTKVFPIKCLRTINELLVYMWLNGKAQAQKGRNDDLVLCLSMGIYLKENVIRMRSLGVASTKSSLNNIHRAMYKGSNTPPHEYTLNAGAGGLEDIRWLFKK